MNLNKMKEEIEAFKRNNGNMDFSQKDMIIYLITKIDNMHETLTDQFPKCSNLFTSKTTFWKLVGLFFALMSALTAYVVYGGK